MIQMTAHSAVLGLDSHEMASASRPTARSTLLSTPNVGLNTSTHSLATITSDSTAGTKYTVRRMRDRRADNFDSTAASTNAIGFCTKIVAAISSSTLRTERQNTGSSVRIVR